MGTQNDNTDRPWDALGKCCGEPRARGSHGLEDQSKVRKDDLERTWIHGQEQKEGRQGSELQLQKRSGNRLQRTLCRDSLGEPGAGCAGQLSLARADFWLWVHSDPQPHHPGTHRL